MMSKTEQKIKRGIDIFVSFVGLIILFPVFLIVALIIKLTSPGPVFFKQERVGKNRLRFACYKFRSMYKDAEKRQKELEHLNEVSGPVFKMKNDPRITPFGRFVRKSSLDELPQLINVLKGEMSLVGPRPPTPQEVENYTQRELRRLEVTPGITCIWQVSGRSEIPFDKWVDMDIEYIDNQSLWLDFKILLKTIPAVLSGRGAY
jgi:exopolysaccharide biosynthesis polyprenyl glycosylphosphotransferase